MPSETDIGNRALSQAGTRSQIASLSEVSKEAKAVAMLLAPVRDTALQLAPWDFARSAATLGLLKAKPGTPENPVVPVSTLWNSTNQPQPPWLYEYAQPNGCITVRWVLPQIQGWPFPGPPTRFVKTSDIGSGGGRIPAILTNAPSALAIFTFQMTDPNTWTPVFQETVVMALAAKLSIPLSGDQRLAGGNLAAANGMLLQARVTDGNESYGTSVEGLPDWIRARDSLPFPYEPPDPLTYAGLFQLN